MIKNIVFLGCDHAGFSMQADVRKVLEQLGFAVNFLGVFSEERCDYPDITKIVCESFLASKKAQFAVLICGTGIGVSIAANKMRGIRCANVWNVFTAEYAKKHNNANVIALGSRTEMASPLKDILKAFAKENFIEGRHEVRIKKITAMEK